MRPWGGLQKFIHPDQERQKHGTGQKRRGQRKGSRKKQAPRDETTEHIMGSKEEQSMYSRSQAFAKMKRAGQPHPKTVGQ